MKLTQTTKPQSAVSVQRAWHLVDMSSKTLGRVSTQVAHLLQGKHKRAFVPYLDAGDYVVVVNASRVVVTGRKLQEKAYMRYSGYPGGLKSETLGDLLQRRPQDVVRHAVMGMLPKNKLRSNRISRLFIYPDTKHPYEHKLKS